MKQKCFHFSEPNEVNAVTYFCKSSLNSINLSVNM